MVRSDSPAASDDVTAANWIRERLSPWSSLAVSSVIPGGFEAYARVLHPVQLPRDGVALVRWAEVSRWSGVPLHPRVQWHEVALPQTTPPGEPPWRSQGPREGTLFIPDALALIEDLVVHTTTPQDCYFCLWNGYAAGGAAMYVKEGTPPVERARPAPPPRLVELPNRDYELFEASLASLVIMLNGRDQQTPNLWWPADQSWCVASEIDLQWTYVGGSSELIDQLLADERLETLVTSPDDPRWIDVAGWLSELISKATDEVLASGSARLTLAGGTVSVQWEPARRRGRGVLVTRSERRNGWSGSTGPMNARDPDELRRQIEGYIRGAVRSLAQT
jgi:hypothetical protein